MLLLLAGFVGVSALVIVTPGQDTALTVRNSLAGGRAAGIATAVGVALGQAVWTTATSAGVAAVLLASQPAFAALRVVGVAYLGWLAFTAFRDALRRDGHDAPPTSARVTTARALRQGLVSNLGNPKMVVFFMSLLPQFAPRGSFLAMLALGLVFCGLTLTWLSLYAVAVERFGRILRRSPVRRALDAITGTVFAALGVRLATTAR
jgi:threonine/homoserine/homoserine lactone efflux protein